MLDHRLPPKLQGLRPVAALRNTTLLVYADQAVAQLLCRDRSGAGGGFGAETGALGAAKLLPASGIFSRARIHTWPRPHPPGMN
jgi:hypothetical protein